MSGPLRGVDVDEDRTIEPDRTRRVRRAAAVMLANHPHVQGLLLGVSLLAAAAVATPAAWHAVRDLGEMPQRVAQPTTDDPPTGPEGVEGVEVAVVSSDPAG